MFGAAIPRIAFALFSPAGISKSSYGMKGRKDAEMLPLLCYPKAVAEKISL